MSTHTTDEITFTADQPGPTEDGQQPEEIKRVIDIHIYEETSRDDEQASIESTVSTPGE